MSGNNLILYIKGEELVEVVEPKVTLGTLVAMECRDQNILNHLKGSVFLRFKEKDYRRTVVSVLKVIEEIHTHYPELEVVNLGAVDMIVAYENQKTPNQMFHILKASMVMVIAFVGAAYSIMAFSNDVDTTQIFDLIYELITGEIPRGVTVLEASYSLGLIIGILVFYNHFGKKKFTVDPTPMEVEMRLYEKDIQTTLIQNYSRKGVELDVGDSGNIDSYRIK